MLVFIGTKMLLSGLVHIPIEWSLGVIAIVLASSVGLSLALRPKPLVE